MGGHPRADLEIGLADSTAVILSNLVMDKGRMVQFSELEKMSKSGASAKPAKRG